MFQLSYVNCNCKSDFCFWFTTVDYIKVGHSLANPQKFMLYYFQWVFENLEFSSTPKYFEYFEDLNLVFFSYDSLY
jgi:hypothetical protein